MKNSYLAKTALINIFILTIDQMITSYVKGGSL